MSAIFLSLEQVLDIHHRVIERYGGTQGLRDQRLLESALAQPRQSAFQSDIYPTVPEKAAAMALDRKSTRLNSSHIQKSRMPSSA